MTPDHLATKGDLERLMDAITDLKRQLQAVTVEPRPEWLRISEAARVAGVSESTIRRKIGSGELQARGSGKMREVKL